MLSGIARRIILPCLLGGILMVVTGCGGAEETADNSKPEIPTPSPELNKSNDSPEGMGDPGADNKKTTPEVPTSTLKPGEKSPAEQPPLLAPK